MINFALINKITQKTLGRDHTFFANPHRHHIWGEDKAHVDPSKITDLSLECVGYGEFYVADIVNRFTNYLKACTKDMPNLKNLRLKVNGFDLNECPNLIVDICQAVQKLPKGSLRLFELQTTRLINCDVIRDFGQILKTALRLGIKQRHGYINAQNPFETLTLQFADWQFTHKGKKCQPTPENLRNQLGLITQEAFGTDGYCFKRFRLQLSTWYYTDRQANIFFHSYSVQQFHSQMQSFVRSCYENMVNLEYFELDLRNWYSDFQMNKLKSLLNQIPKEGAQNMSINSKNISKMKKIKEENRMSFFEKEKDEDDDQVILFERYIMV